MKRDIFLFSALIFCVLACGDGSILGFQRVTGKGNPVKEDRTVDNFTGVSLGCAADVILQQGSETKVTVEGAKNIIDELETKVENGVLYIRFKGKMKSYSYQTLNVYVQTPTVESLAVSSSGGMKAETPLKGKELKLKLSGSGSIELPDLAYEALQAEVSASGGVVIKNATIAGDVAFKVSGSGSLTCAGTAKNAAMAVSGSGGIEADGLALTDLNASVSGSGSIECNATGNMNAIVGGSGDIRYVGKPSGFTSKVTGSGSISPK